ncbi:hypothetical protein QBC46DRAFT_414208 [Diplogelasinospora grovesii]|uniref:Uncharacterized protein n=1 Tax=Diplogelasinospora grovesii TaxID=303347 RepID=A0AAN6MVK2_9PEZI|nr:hypothetical protein QBC46DRAFT_414208 [Diplogelasinospora grovesii]
MSLFLNYNEGLKETNELLAGNLDLLLAVEKVSGQEAAEQRLKLYGVALNKFHFIQTGIRIQRRRSVLKNNPPLVNQLAPDEEFAPGAFDNDDSDDDIEDYDELESEEDEEDNYLQPSKQV